MKLPALQTDNQRYAVLELDRAPQLANLLGLDVKLESGLGQLNLVLADIITHLASYPSAVVADPVYSYPLLLADIEKGLILRLGQISGEIHPGSVPRLTDNWGVDEIANNYAVAKLEMMYHPAETGALDKKKIVAELHDYCQHMSIDFILKLSILTQPDEPREGPAFQETQLLAIQELREFTDMFVLEYPGDAMSAATLTAELDNPWLVNLNAQDYEDNKQHLRAALENGAAGFFVSDALWREIGQFRQEDQSVDLSKVQKFIETTARDRIIELARIVQES